MPRTARASAANVCYHVLNRGNNRARVFHKDGDFRHLSITTGSRCAGRMAEILIAYAPEPACKAQDICPRQPSGRSMAYNSPTGDISGCF